MLFAALPEEVRASLREDARERSFGDGQIIQQRGDQAEGFWLIESGSVAVGQFLAGGEFRGVALLGPGDSWGELAMFADRPRVVDALARSVCKVRHIRAPQFEAALSDHPLAMRDLLGALSRQLQDVLDVVAGIRRGSGPTRVAAMLLTLSEKSDVPHQIRIAQQELGELLGLTRATVNSALREFERQGLVTRRYGMIELCNAAGLQRAALD